MVIGMAQKHMGFGITELNLHLLIGSEAHQGNRGVHQAPTEMLPEHSR